MSAAEQRTLPEQHTALHYQRWELLRHLDQALHKPLVALSFVWVGLLIVDFTRGLNTPLLYLTYGIWAVFVLDFVVEFVIAPHKLTYLRAHWLTAIALVLPGLRVLAIFRALAALRIAAGARPAGILRLVSSLNRGMGALSETLGRRGFGFIVAFTILVVFASAGAIGYYESPAALHAAGYPSGTGLKTYLDALWWTAMMVTTMGSEYWPRTGEGRLVAFLLALYAFAIFGYITATIASFFVRSDTTSELQQTTQKESAEQSREVRAVGMEAARAEARAEAGEAAEVAALRAEMAALRSQMAVLLARLDGQATSQANGQAPGATTSRHEPART